MFNSSVWLQEYPKMAKIKVLGVWLTTRLEFSNDEACYGELYEKNFPWYMFKYLAQYDFKNTQNWLKFKVFQAISTYIALSSKFYGYQDLNWYQ